MGHDSHCPPGCNDSHDWSDHSSKDYWGGPDHDHDRNGSDGGCFPASALIKTLAGEVPLGRVEEGDIILSWDGSGALVPRRVTRKLAYGKKPLVYVAFEDGGGVNTTASHSFLTDTGWKRLGQVKPGDTFITLSGPRKIVSVSPAAREAVFNLYTAVEHNFIADGCIAHNFSHLRTLRTFVHRILFDGFDCWPVPQC